MINPVSLEILYVGIIGLAAGVVGLVFVTKNQSKQEVK
jgi:Co/Zn/Cd efflux system component